MDVRLIRANKTVQDTKVDFKLQLVPMYSCVHCALHTANTQAQLLHYTLWFQAVSSHSWRTQMCAHTHDNDTPRVLSHLELKVCKLHYIPVEVPCLRMYYNSQHILWQNRP